MYLQRVLLQGRILAGHFTLYQSGLSRETELSPLPLLPLPLHPPPLLFITFLQTFLSNPVCYTGTWEVGWRFPIKFWVRIFLKVNAWFIKT